MGPTRLSSERKKAHAGFGPAVSLTRVQIRLQIELSLEEYVAQKVWARARLLRCPLHPEGGCGFSSHGSYLRKYPMPFRIARAYCPKGQTTFGLIPDFAASHVPGTLPEIEAAVVVYEAEENIYRAADIMRPPKELPGGRDPITQEATAQWLRRRVGWVRAMLITVAGLFPELFSGCEMTLTAFRARLRSDSVLMDLRGICAEELLALPIPVGFSPPSDNGKAPIGAVQQSLRSDRPP
jgi:hypothetical protein